LQFESIFTSHHSIAASTLGRRISGACFMKSHLIASASIPGAALGEQLLKGDAPGRLMLTDEPYNVKIAGNAGLTASSPWLPAR
jgi:hypothetical protein